MYLLRTGGQRNEKKITKFSVTKVIKFICIVAAYVWFAIFCLLAFIDFNEQKKNKGNEVSKKPILNAPLRQAFGKSNYIRLNQDPRSQPLTNFHTMNS